MTDFHDHIQALLYEYLRDELSEDKRRTIEDHLSVCTRCGRELEEMRAFDDLSLKHCPDASEERSAEFWDRFALDVEERIQSDRKPGKELFTPIFEAIEYFFGSRRRAPVAIGIALAIITVVVSITLWRTHFQHEESETVSQVAPPQPVETATVLDPRMGAYFRKSKVLLVGLTNMKISENHPVDLSAEQRTSRELIHQARYLKSRPLDIRSARLINDLEKILIELANLKQENDLPNVEIIRGGIHRENLLFKIRMAESFYDSASSPKTLY